MYAEKPLKSRQKKEKYMAEKKSDEIELQLHEQYADNNNSYLGHIVTLVAGLFAVIAFYGNVFIEASHYFEKIEDYSYSLGDLCIVAVCAYIALGIMAYLCIYLGMHQRHEQFVVWAIRNKYYGYNYNSHFIYSDDYVPFNKKGFENIKGLYGEFVKIISLVTLCITVSLAAKIGVNIFELQNNGVSVWGVTICIITSAVYILIYIICVLCFKRGEDKYQDLYNKYKHLYPGGPQIIKQEYIPLENFKKTPNKKIFENIFIITSLFRIKNKTDENKQKQTSNNI